jgi:ketosteroid isomerase-like protein
MSQENVEIVRRGFDVWNSGDMGAYRALLDPDFVLRPPQIWAEPGPFVGREAALREFEQARRWVERIRSAP